MATIIIINVYIVYFFGVGLIIFITDSFKDNNPATRIITPIIIEVKYSILP